MRDWPPRGDRETSVIKIAVGVVLGILAAGLISVVVRAWLIQRAVEQGIQSLQQINKQAEQANRVMLERARSDQVEHACQVQEREAAQRADMAVRQHAENTARQATFDETNRREAAWAKFYRKPQLCSDNPSTEALVECANEFIRAKRAFEAAYAAGKL